MTRDEEVNMANEKTNGSRRLFNTLLLLLDLGLLVWIGTSWYAQRNAEPASDKPEIPYAFSEGGVSHENTPDGTSPGGIGGGSDSWILGPTGGEPADPPTEPDSGQTAPPAADQTPGPDNGQTAEPDPAPEDGASRFGTVSRPESSDFQAWYEQNILGDIPSDAQPLVDFREITGEWKGLIRYETPDRKAVTASELLNFTISGTDSKAEMLFDWYLILYGGDGEWMNEEDMEDTVFSGSFSNGSLTVSGPGTVRITAFYEYEDAQFAVGEMDAPDGSFAVIAMTRP